MIRQPKDVEVLGHWALLALCLGVIVFICAWSLGAAFLAALRSMP